MNDRSWPGNGPVASVAHTVGILLLIFGAAFYSVWAWLYSNPEATTERHAIPEYNTL